MSNPIKDGGPAFPVPMFTRQADGQPMSAGEFFEGGCGMTLRDHFAGIALQGIAAVTIQSAAGSRANPDETKAELANACYAIADAMLAARQPKEDAP